MEQVPRKGLSKGCLIGLIIGGALLVIVIIFFVLAYIYRDEFMKAGTKATMNMMKVELTKNPPAGIDTVRFDALTDKFISRIYADSVDLMKYQQFIPVVQKVMKDNKIDQSEIRELSDAMVLYYPDLSDLAKNIVIDSDTVNRGSDSIMKQDSTPPSQK
jgi:hypothetical protein